MCGLVHPLTLRLVEYDVLHLVLIRFLIARSLRPGQEHLLLHYAEPIELRVGVQRALVLVRVLV